jgi:anti-sigma factor RsiW
MHNVRLDDLVRYLYGELNAEQKKAVEAALEADPELRDKMKTLSVSKKRLDALSFY